MRIIAGTKKGMKLLCPKTQDTRPITDRVKESLFNILRSRELLVDRRVADLFSGVGSLGLEALSRGAQFATFIEQDPKIAAYLDKNIAKAGFVAQSKVVRANAFRVGALAAGVAAPQYDLVFVDPPYARTREVGAGSLLDQLFAVLSHQVAEQGIAIVRTERGVDLLDTYGSFDAIDRREWGSMTLAFYQGRGHDE
jgi:16S rRNA (guanine966-N2)-methyltransferase